MGLGEVLLVVAIIACCTGVPALVFYGVLRVGQRVWAFLSRPE